MELGIPYCSMTARTSVLQQPFMDVGGRWRMDTLSATRFNYLYRSVIACRREARRATVG